MNSQIELVLIYILRFILHDRLEMIANVENIEYNENIFRTLLILEMKGVLSNDLSNSIHVPCATHGPYRRRRCCTRLRIEPLMCNIKGVSRRATPADDANIDQLVELIDAGDEAKLQELQSQSDGPH